MMAYMLAVRLIPSAMTTIATVVTPQRLARKRNANVKSCLSQPMCPPTVHAADYVICLVAPPYGVGWGVGFTRRPRLSNGGGCYSFALGGPAIIVPALSSWSGRDLPVDSAVESEFRMLPALCLLSVLRKMAGR